MDIDAPSKILGLFALMQLDNKAAQHNDYHAGRLSLPSKIFTSS